MNPASSPAAVQTCSRCTGTGLDGVHACPLCKGIGFGASRGDFFLYWGRRIDGVAIALASAMGVVNVIIDGLLLALLAAGIALLGLHVNATPVAEVLTRSFWTMPHPAFLVFWAGALAACIWHYRRAVRSTRHEDVRVRAYGDSGEGGRSLGQGDAIWEAVNRLPRKRRIDVAKAYSRQSNHAIDAAYGLARKLESAEIMPAHLFGMLLASQKVAVVFAKLGLQFEMFRESLGRLLAESPKDPLGTGMSETVRGILIDAYVDAYEGRRHEVEVTDLLLATLRADKGLQELLYDRDVDMRKIENVVEWVRVQDLLRQRNRQFSSAARLKPKGTMDRAMTALATPYLDRLSRDLTRAAAFGHLAPVVGRDAELSAVFRAIEGGRKSAILVGRPGTGRSAIIDGIAQRMVEEDVPAVLQDKRLVSLDIAQLVAGAGAAEAQERLLGALYEVARAGNIVLVVEDVAGMVGITAGSSESIDLSRVFANELSRGYFFCIATATPEAYGNAVERSPLGQALVKVDVPEVGEDAAIRILEAKIGNIEYRNDVWFSYGAVEAAVRLSDRYIHESTLPEKAIEVAREAASAVRKSKGKDATVTAEDVAALVAEKTNIPLTKVTAEETEKLLGLEDRMHERMIGQDRAVTSVAAALRRARAELREQDRPIANFLFLGPTGVGKTELAKTLAAEYFGNESAMIRLDMSEYQDKPSLYKLIGEPAGNAGGILTEAVRRQPFSLVLLDEIEKANPDVLTVFLQVMDDGRLTDNVGRTVDFTNVILIATSNAGSQYVQDSIRAGMAVEVIKDGLMNEQLKGVFRPEFLNRFDDIVVFAPLSEAEIGQIARLMLKKVAKRLEDKGILFEATDEAVAELAKAGFDPVFGARPLRRVIQDRVDNVIADAVLGGKLGRRDKLIYDKGGVLRIEKAREL
jgi:ATP-dependent Clp protease ATP-binding subunit ClpC